MKLIVGLGNYWDKYINTRHNAWFMFVDYLAEKENFSDYKFESKFKAEISTGICNWEKTLLIKPQTYMNLSWEAVSLIKQFYKTHPDDLIIIYDDISMDFWKVRFRDKWSAGGQNGIKDIIRILWEEFKRIKIWIWLHDKYEVSDWVLSKFKEEELIDLNNEVFPEVYNILKEKI